MTYSIYYQWIQEGTGPYEDQSGMMGFSYPSTDWPDMCFNSAKSYQTDWYTDSTIVINPSDESSGVNFETCYTGSLYGIADYVQDSDRNVIIKINSPGTAADHFVSFNRRTGINSSTVEGGNQVLIQQAEGEGEVYATSKLVGKLSQGESHTLSNFLSTGKNVVISVDSINLSNPGTANIRIEYDGVRYEREAFIIQTLTLFDIYLTTPLSVCVQLRRHICAYSTANSYTTAIPLHRAFSLRRA